MKPCNVTFEKYKEITTYLLAEYRENDAYVESIPSDIRDGIFNNAFANSMGLIIDRLLDEIIGDSLAELFFEYLGAGKISFYNEENCLIVADTDEKFFEFVESHFEFKK